MDSNIQKKIYLGTFAFLLFAQSTGIASVVMQKGSATDKDPEAFPFPISAQAYHPSSTQGFASGIASWFVGVGEPLTGDDGAYSIAYAQPGSPVLSPLVTSTSVFVNNVPQQPHPLRGRPIRLLKLLGINPLVVPADNPSELILFNIATDPQRVLAIKLVDTQEKPFAVMDLATLQNPGRIPDVIVVNPNMTIMAAIRPLQGVFGDPGSGLAMIMTALVKDPNEKDKKNNDTFHPKELQLGIFGTISLDRMSRFIAMGHPVSSLGDAVTLHACEALNRFFVGVNVTSDMYAGDGVVAALVAGVAPPPEGGGPVSITMEPIVSQTIVDGEHIIAARITASQCPIVPAAHLLRSTQTTMESNYLASRSAFALALIAEHATRSQCPVVTHTLRPTQTTMGAHHFASRSAFALARIAERIPRPQSPTVAAHRLRTMQTSTGLDYLIVNGGCGDDDHTSRTVFALPLLRASGKLAHAYAPPVTSYYGKIPVGRSFVVSPGTSADLYTSSSTPAIVGGGALHAPVTDMLISGDSVFVITNDNDAHSNVAGIWRSQAIFGKEGTIISWTPWHRTGGVNSATSLKNFAYDDHRGTWWLVTGDRQARATTWTGASPLSTIVKDALGKQSGSYSIHEATRTEHVPGLLIITRGVGVLLVQTDHTTHKHVSMAMDHDSALATIGPLTSSAVICTESSRWVVVGGNKGVAILTKPDGSGFAPGEQISEATSDMAWRIVPLQVSGNPVTNVRKLIYDNDCLYILTTTQVVRVSRDQLLQNQHQIVPTVIATIRGLGGSAYSSCADMFISGPLACIATSIGSFRSGNGVNISAATGEHAAQWTRIDLPYSPGPVTSFVPIGPASRASDRGIDANLYVLSAAATSSQARIYRLAISHTGVVTDDTVSLFPDEVAQGKPGFFLSIGDYRNRIATDGSLLAATRNRCGKQPAYVELYHDWQLWPRGLTKGISLVRAGYRGVSVNSANEVDAMLHSNSLGSWLVLTDIGLISNE